MGGGGMIEVPLFKGLTFFSGGGVIYFLVGHFEKGSSDFSRIIINDYTIFFTINVTFGKKFKTKLYQNILQYLSNGFQIYLIEHKLK